MSSLFRDMYALAGGIVDLVYGEDFEVIPMGLPNVAGQPHRNVNLRRVSDTTRARFIFTASFTSLDDEQSVEGRRMARTGARGTIGPNSVLDVATDDLPYLPRENDLIRRVATDEIFVLAKEISEDIGRSYLTLGQVVSGSSGG